MAWSTTVLFMTIVACATFIIVFWLDREDSKRR